MRALFLTLLTLFLASTAWAQPWGPWTIAELPTGSALHNPQVCLRNSDTADVFYQIADTVFHAAVEVTTGSMISAPTAFPMEGSGWARQLCDVVATTEGWAALVYDTTTNVNRTTVFRGRDALEADTLIDEGQVMYSGEWVSVSINRALSLSPRGGSGFFAAWLNEWMYDDPWFWGEGGAGPVALSFASGDTFLRCENVFSGPSPYEGSTIDVLDVASDSDIVITCGHYFEIDVWRALWNDRIDLVSYTGTAVHNVGLLFTDGGTVLLVSRSLSGYDGPHQACVLRIDSLSTSAVVQTLEDEPIIASSDPDFGIAWLAWHGPAILLYRADTTGAEYLPAGPIHWPVQDSVIVEAAVGMSHEGKIAAVWSERVAGSANATLLRMKSLNWDTPLSVSDREFILPPSSFVLSAYPNPFNSTLKIEYALPHAGNVELSVFNVLGQKVETLLSARVESGTHTVTWNPGCAGGVYFVTMKTETVARTTKVLYLR